MLVALLQSQNRGKNAFRARIFDADLVKFDRMRESMVGDLKKLYAYKVFTGFTFLTGERILKDAENYVDPVPVIGNGGRRQPIKTWVPLSTIISENRTGVNSRVMAIEKYNDSCSQASPFSERFREDPVSAIEIFGRRAKKSVVFT